MNAKNNNQYSAMISDVLVFVKNAPPFEQIEFTIYRIKKLSDGICSIIDGDTTQIRAYFASITDTLNQALTQLSCGDKLDTIRGEVVMP